MAANQRRVRVTLDVDADLAAELRARAKREKTNVADWVRDAILERLQAIKEAELAARVRKPKRETLEQRQNRFLMAVEKRFAVVAACRLSGIDRDQVRAWMGDEEFADRFAEAQEAYVEWVESKLIRLGMGRIKGQVLALLSFLNAHHPAYGRLRVEQISRLVGQMLESWYAVILEMAGETLGSAIVKRLREIADRKMVGFSD